MDGQPVWLCSVSCHGNNAIPGKKPRTVATGEWTPEMFATAEKLAHAALKGVGDESRERAFRMNITFCIHRAVSDKEKAKLPAKWATAPGGLAGGPIQVLWSRGIEHKPASMPCENPTHMIIDLARPDLWAPGDCGLCEPCKARAKIVANLPTNPLAT